MTRPGPRPPAERVEAVIVNYGDPAAAIACAQRLDGLVAGTLVVDNASGGDAVQRLRDAGLRVLARPVNDGFGAAVNAGFAATDAPYVLVLNDDVRPLEGAVAALTALLDADPGCGVAAPALVNPDGSHQPSAYRRVPDPAFVFCELCAPIAYLTDRMPRLDRRHVPAEALRTGAPIAWATGAALLIRREAFDAAGPLDERFFMYFEEVEFETRVRAAGFTVRWVAEACFEHGAIGGAERPAHSPHWIVAAERFLALRGHSPLRRRLAIGGGLLGARVGLRLMALAVPRLRPLLRVRAAAYDELARLPRGDPGAGVPRAPHGA